MPSFEISGRDLKKLYPDYVSSADASRVRYAAERQMPLLGICAGMQAMGVLLGEGRVKLHENLSEITSYSHRSVPAVQKAHAVSVLSDSRLAAITGAETLDVNSRHFQGLFASLLEQTPAVRAVAFVPDGVVEAVEFSAHPNFMAVQFYPGAAA